MGKAFALVVVGLFVIIWGCRTQSGPDAKVEHLVGTDTVTITCRGGEPVEEFGGYQADAARESHQEELIREKCEAEQSSQQTSARVLLVIGLLTAGYGALELRKARS